MYTARVKLGSTTLRIDQICGWHSWTRTDYGRAGDAMTSVYLVNGGACELVGEWEPTLDRAFDAFERALESAA